MMKTLRFTTLPSDRSDEETSSQQVDRDGFVDEAAVFALLNSPPYPRSSSYPEDLALAADDLDFAGWQIPSTPVARPAEFPPQVIDAIVRRASPPSSTESVRSTTPSGSSRWWVAGVAGAISTLLFLIGLISFLSHPRSNPSSAAPALDPPVMILEVAPDAQLTQELTDASPRQPE